MFLFSIYSKQSSSFEFVFAPYELSSRDALSACSLSPKSFIDTQRKRYTQDVRCKTSLYGRPNERQKRPAVFVF
jgi:hypothetical protein